MEKVLYIKLPQTASVPKNEIRLGDVAELWCLPEEAKNRWKTLLLKKLQNRKQKHVVISVLDIRQKIQEIDSQVSVNFLGKEEVVVDCREKMAKNSPLSLLRTALVSVVAFTGGAFAIMTFNNDVDVGMVFAQIYFLTTGEISDGTTVIEAAYSLGLFLGMVVFFNHFAGWKLTEDPTPLEVQMRKYDDDVAAAVTEYEDRKKRKEKRES